MKTVNINILHDEEHFHYLINASSFSFSKSQSISENSKIYFVNFTFGDMKFCGYCLLSDLMQFRDFLNDSSNVIEDQNFAFQVYDNKVAVIEFVEALERVRAEKLIKPTNTSLT